MDNPSLKDTKEGASAITAGREFHKGTVRGKKLYLKESVDGEKRLYLFEWVALVLDVEGYWSDTGLLVCRSGCVSLRRIESVEFWIFLIPVIPIGGDRA